jgi:hypothetical protein
LHACPLEVSRNTHFDQHDVTISVSAMLAQRSGTWAKIKKKHLQPQGYKISSTRVKLNLPGIE